MHRAGFRLRAAAVLAAGALAVHQLRYALAYGHDASSALARQGHAYLAFLVPLVVLVFLTAAGALLARVARGEPAGSPAPLGFARAWRWSTAVLGASFVLQEELEGALSQGHPAGLAALLANRGWIFIPLTLAVGALAALVLREAERVAGALPATRALELTRWPGRRVAVTPSRGWTPALAPLARNLAGRGPPLLPASV